MKKIIFIVFVFSGLTYAVGPIQQQPALFHSTVEVDSLTASRALTTNGSKVLTSSATTSTELLNLSGSTQNIQSTLNGKQASGNYITSLTNDGAAAGPGAVAFTLATVNSNVGTFGSATKASVVTVNGKGLVTAASESTVTPAIGSITGFGAGIATWLATPTSANLASALTDESGTGTLVFSTGSTISLANATGLPVSTGVSGLGSNVATFLATPSSANLASAITNETGTGTLVFSTGSTIDLTSATGLPISTGVSGLGSNIATFLTTPTSANLASAITNETGTGTLVFSTGSTIDLTNATGLPVSTGISGFGSGIATFLATPTSANLASAITNETGTGALVFSTGSTIDLTNAVNAPSASVKTVVTPLATGNMTDIVVEFRGSTSGTVCTSNPCTMVKNYGSGYSSIGRNGTGDDTANFTTNFSDTPICTCNTYSEGGTGQYCVVVLETTSSVNIRTYNGASTLADGHVNLRCSGPK